MLRQMHTQKLKVIDAINVEFAQIRNRIDIIIHDTARELNELKAGQTSSYNDLFSRTKAAVDNSEDRMSGFESRVREDLGKDKVEEAESTKAKGICFSSRPSRSSWGRSQRSGESGAEISWDTSTQSTQA